MIDSVQFCVSGHMGTSTGATEAPEWTPQMSNDIKQAT